MSTIDCPWGIQTYLKSVLGDDFSVSSAHHAKSAQQQVLILKCHFAPTKTTTTTTTTSTRTPPPTWREALYTGRNHLVVRIWKGAARWWNLNSNEPGAGVVRIARAEVAGYRMARRALVDRESSLHMPVVLYFSREDTSDNPNDDNPPPWAIMSYVGPDSVFFDTGHQHCTKWTDGMVKVRREFGFDEPHPRWGRVPQEECLGYALTVLQEFVLPMHRYFFATASGRHLEWSDLERIRHHGHYRYLDMVLLYQTACSEMEMNINGAAPSDAKLEESIARLHMCIEKLHLETHVVDATHVPPVLCHMDCQPQNLLFFRGSGSNLSRISSVLDWEEAAYADPRFELLLLCRKVCANRNQAQALWDRYSNDMKQAHDLEMGSIEPWLKLETVHSITTLLLQTMDMLDGGRSPWETKPDLLGKVEREFRRLAWLGWEFCGPELDEETSREGRFKLII